MSFSAEVARVNYQRQRDMLKGFRELSSKIASLEKERGAAQRQQEAQAVSHAVGSEMVLGETLVLPSAPSGLPKTLGSGAFGDVHEATLEVMVPTAVSVAVKVFKTGMVLTDDTLRSAVVKEMELMQSVRHESIVTFLGPIYVRQSDGSTDLVGYAMERMECDLKAYLLRKRQQGQLGIKTVLEVLEQVARGLDALHSHPECIVHRDLKAKNVLVKDGRFKISDLGVGRALAGAHLADLTAYPGDATTVPPDSQTGYTTAYDMYSLGVLLAEMLHCLSRPQGDKGWDEVPLDRSERERFVEQAGVKDGYVELSALLLELTSPAEADRPTAKRVVEVVQLIAAAAAV